LFVANFLSLTFSTLPKNPARQKHSPVGWRVGFPSLGRKMKIDNEIKKGVVMGVSLVVGLYGVAYLLYLLAD